MVFFEFLIFFLKCHIQGFELSGSFGNFLFQLNIEILNPLDDTIQQLISFLQFTVTDLKFLSGIDKTADHFSKALGQRTDFIGGLDFDFGIVIPLTDFLSGLRQEINFVSDESGLKIMKNQGKEENRNRKINKIIPVFFKAFVNPFKRDADVKFSYAGGFHKF